MKLSQNKKIILSAAMLFLASFFVLLFFLSSYSHENNHNGSANVMHATDISVDNSDESEELDKPFFLINIEGEVKKASDKFCELISQKCEYFVGNKLFDFINAKDLPDFISVYTELIQHKKQIDGAGPFRMLQGDKEIILLFSMTPVLCEEGNVVEIMFTVKDLTEQINELNEFNNGLENGEQSDSQKKKNNDNWIYGIYPKIRDMKDQTEIKLVVDKISFKKD